MAFLQHMFDRTLRVPAKGSCLVLGPRQTGKSTLVRGALPKGSHCIDLLEHDTFLRYAKEPGLFRLEAERRIAAGARVVFVDEVQKVPALLDECHALIERHKVRVILTGSSARKLRRGSSNLLAGRAVLRHLHPLTRAELGTSFELERALHLGTLPRLAFITTGRTTAPRSIS